MVVLKIDESKCKKDGICARDCLPGAITLSGPDGLPQITPENEYRCMLCGHCVAACPHDAINLNAIPIEVCPPIEEGLKINEFQAKQFLRSRRSARLYLDRPVEREKIEKLIEVARYAPTGGNRQVVEWLVLTDKALIHEASAHSVEWLRKLVNDNPVFNKTAPYFMDAIMAWDAGQDQVLKNAPAIVIASAPDNLVTGMVDITIALTYLDLFAPTIGLGTCWAGMLQGALLRSPSLKTLLGIPADHSHHYPLMVGYHKSRYHRLPERKPPKITFR